MSEQLLWFALAVLPLVATSGPDIPPCVAQGWAHVVGHMGLGAWALRRAACRERHHAELPRSCRAGRRGAGGARRGVAVRDRPPTRHRLAALARDRHDPPSNPERGVILPNAPPLSLARGLLTSFLNPRGLLIYLSVLPPFIAQDGDPAVQALALSGVSVALCHVVHAAVGLLAARSAGAAGASPPRARIVEGTGGTMLGAVATKRALDWPRSTQARFEPPMCPR